MPLSGRVILQLICSVAVCIGSLSVTAYMVAQPYGPCFLDDDPNAPEQCAWEGYASVVPEFYLAGIVAGVLAGIPTVVCAEKVGYCHAVLQRIAFVYMVASLLYGSFMLPFFVSDCSCLCNSLAQYGNICGIWDYLPATYIPFLLFGWLSFIALFFLPKLNLGGAYAEF